MLPENLEIVTAKNSPAAITFSETDPHDLTCVASIIVSTENEIFWQDVDGKNHAIPLENPDAAMAIRDKTEIFLCALGDNGPSKYITVPLHHGVSLTSRSSSTHRQP